MKTQNGCITNNHEPNGVVITAEGALLLSSRVFLFFSFLLLPMWPCHLSVFALDLPAASLILTSTASRPTLARRWEEAWMRQQPEGRTGTLLEHSWTLLEHSGTLLEQDSPALQSLAMPLSFSRLFLYPEDCRNANKKKKCTQFNVIG